MITVRVDVKEAFHLHCEWKAVEAIEASWDLYNCVPASNIHRPFPLKWIRRQVVRLCD